VMGTVGSAFAIHAEIPAETQAVVAKGTTQITLGGELRFRGEYKRNNGIDPDSAATVTTTTQESQPNNAAYDGRVRLRLQADVTKNTQGVVHIEGGSSTTGDSYTWGSTYPTDSENKGIYGVGNGKRGSLNILEAWILHKFNIGVPAGIKIGHMPLALGNKLFFDHTKFGDDAIVFFMDPTKQLHIGLLTIKLNEDNSANTSGTNNNDDADAYVALFAYKGQGFNVSGDVTYVDDKQYGLNTNGSAGALNTNGNKGTHLINYGLRGDVTFGAFNIMADAEVQSGKSKFTNDSASDIKLKGRAFMVGASYKTAPATIRAKYAYGSGDKNNADNESSIFVTAMGASQHYTYVYEYRVAGASGTTATGLANTTYVNVGVSSKLTKDLSADVDYYVLRATKQNTISGTELASKKMGNELDAKVVYQLDRNLVYFVEGGYLWTGKAYDSTTAQADDAYAIRHGVTLSF